LLPLVLVVVVAAVVIKLALRSGVCSFDLLSTISTCWLSRKLPRDRSWLTDVERRARPEPGARSA
jgi:hypothetical protein